jgi:two-component system phosphate regulon sensor histidine kinase PhoR
VDKSRFKETGGIGLGLSIVKQVADSHGAEIEVSSELNKGTSVSVHFPEAS